MTRTVIGHVLSRLKQIGIDGNFGVPGGDAFPVDGAVCNGPAINWIGWANELNAGHAADGYARSRGGAALRTTYGVGEPSASTRSRNAMPSLCRSSTWPACRTSPRRRRWR